IRCLVASLACLPAGLQCYCSTPADLPLTLVKDGAICEEPCSGNAQEICGGSYALTMYQFDD
ncbi:unnamed protein product, partial [Scytosiphon promiscuus]